MEIDCDKLIALVQMRPAIFNYMMKEHRNKEIIDKLWEEVGSEMKFSVSECRLKWTNLKNFYSRYLREEKKMVSGSGATKKKKWFYADAMSFLKDFSGQHKQSSSNLNSNDEIEKENLDSEKEIERDEVTSPDMVFYSDNFNIHSVPNAKQPKQKKMTPAEALAGPMAEFLQSRTQKPPSTSPFETNSAHMYFFRGLLPDIEHLSTRRQRTFRMKTLQLIHELLDEQENEIINSSSTEQGNI